MSMTLLLGLTLGEQQYAAGPAGPTYTVSVSGDVGGVARIGVQLTASASGYSEAPPASVAFTWPGVAGTPTGTNGEFYTPVAGDDLATIYPVATPSDTYAPKNGPSYPVQYAPPVAAGGIADQVYDKDVAITPLDVSSDFTGDGMAFALAPTSAALPAGLSLSGAGLLTGTPTATANALAVIVRGTNSGDFADTAFNLTVESISLVPTVDAQMEITGSGDISLTVTSPAAYAGGPYTTDASNEATGTLNTGTIATGPQSALNVAIARTTGASDVVGSEYTATPSLWLYDDSGSPVVAGEWYLDGVATGDTDLVYLTTSAGDVDYREGITGAGAARTATSNVISVAAVAGPIFLDTFSTDYTDLIASDPDWYELADINNNTIDVSGGVASIWGPVNSGYTDIGVDVDTAAQDVYVEIDVTVDAYQVEFGVSSAYSGALGRPKWTDNIRAIMASTAGGLLELQATGISTVGGGTGHGFDTTQKTIRMEIRDNGGIETRVLVEGVQQIAWTSTPNTSARYPFISWGLTTTTGSAAASINPVSRIEVGAL